MYLSRIGMIKAFRRSRMTGYRRLYELSLSLILKRKKVILVKKRERGRRRAAHEQSEFSYASHQCADQPDHHDRRDDPHYHFHDFFHLQGPLLSISHGCQL